MIQNSETICDDNGIELLIGYQYEPADFDDEDGGTGTMVCTELETVELVIAGRGINILPLLHENEKEFIISKLQYE